MRYEYDHYGQPQQPQQATHQHQEHISFGYEEQVDEQLSDFESGETEQGKVQFKIENDQTNYARRPNSS